MDMKDISAIMNQLNKQQSILVPASREFLTRNVLRLPEGLTCTSVHAMYTIDGMGFVVYGKNLPETPLGADLPRWNIDYHSCDACGGPIFDGFSDPLTQKQHWNW